MYTQLCVARTSLKLGWIQVLKPSLPVKKTKTKKKFTARPPYSLLLVMFGKREEHLRQMKQFVVVENVAS